MIVNPHTMRIEESTVSYGLPSKPFAVSYGYFKDGKRGHEAGFVWAADLIDALERVAVAKARRFPECAGYVDVSADVLEIK